MYGAFFGSGCCGWGELPQVIDDVAVWWSLRQQAPAGYGALLRWPGRSVVSYSPECLVQADAGYVWSSPIKGSRSPEAAADLAEAEKDAAELTMIVDLARNDLGRCAMPSVSVTGPHTLALAYVHHREAVRAQLQKNTQWSQLWRALFPAGSITGAPKAAAMHLCGSLRKKAVVLTVAASPGWRWSNPARHVFGGYSHSNW